MQRTVLNLNGLKCAGLGRYWSITEKEEMLGMFSCPIRFLDLTKHFCYCLLLACQNAL